MLPGDQSVYKIRHACQCEAKNLKQLDPSALALVQVVFLVQKGLLSLSRMTELARDKAVVFRFRRGHTG